MCILLVILAVGLVSGNDFLENLISGDDGKIVGGMTTDISIYPYQVSIEYIGSHSCGGALIGETWVLTAAHCTDGVFPIFLAVRAGSSYQGTGGTVVRIKNKYQHKKYNSVKFDYDIALLELSEPITSEYAEVVALPANNTIPQEGEIGTVTGWGTTFEDGNLSKKLRVVEVPVISQTECRKEYGKDIITERMFCAGYPEGAKDACQGDSGGPLIINGKLMGIVSWGNGCARSHQPGVYTNVARFRKYIKYVSGI
ncbi:trypsin-7 isoform X1 [Leptinotarsa decemlineata]|uniref:trypsin-7 isoform X1 n=2 Tax=Leptinotarsa decemlineata TaxID=7539 RepID=UPI003D30B27E